MENTIHRIVRTLRVMAVRAAIVGLAAFGAAHQVATPVAALLARQAPTSAGPVDPKVIEDLVAANHILAGTEEPVR